MSEFVEPPCRSCLHQDENGVAASIEVTLAVAVSVLILLALLGMALQPGGLVDLTQENLLALVDGDVDFGDGRTSNPSDDGPSDYVPPWLEDDSNVDRRPESDSDRTPGGNSGGRSGGGSGGDSDDGLGSESEEDSGGNSGDRSGDGSGSDSSDGSGSEPDDDLGVNSSDRSDDGSGSDSGDGSGSESEEDSGDNSGDRSGGGSASDSSDGSGSESGGESSGGSSGRSDDDSDSDTSDDSGSESEEDADSDPEDENADESDDELKEDSDDGTDDDPEDNEDDQEDTTEDVTDDEAGSSQQGGCAGSPCIAPRGGISPSSGWGGCPVTFPGNRGTRSGANGGERSGVNGGVNGDASARPGVGLNGNAVGGSGSELDESVSEDNTAEYARKFSAQLGTVDEFVRHVSLLEKRGKLSELSNFKGVGDSWNGKRYLLIKKGGVIDFRHFFAAMTQRLTGTPVKNGRIPATPEGPALLLGVLNEVSQCMDEGIKGELHSCFAKEDLISNRLGAGFGEHVVIKRSEGSRETVAALLAPYLESLDPLPPEEIAKMQMQTKPEVFLEGVGAVLQALSDALVPSAY